MKKRKRTKKSRYMSDLFWERIKLEKIQLTDKIDNTSILLRTWVEEKGDKFHRFRRSEFIKVFLDNMEEMKIEKYKY